MTTSAIETKIERLAEAFEALALAVYAAKETPGIRTHGDVRDSREEMKTALREFLAPSLRLVPAPPVEHTAPSRCPICLNSFDVWPRCNRPDCHDGRGTPV